MDSGSYPPVTPPFVTDGFGLSLLFDLFQLSEEHQIIRDAVRALARGKVAPHAAAADENGRVPAGQLRRAAAADFHAPHIPEEYGGAGADALATVIVIEEVARACASSSLIPAVNKLGTLPLLLAGSDELKQRYLTPVARGEACSPTACPSPRRAATRPA